jgi:hypothetical protein
MFPPKMMLMVLRLYWKPVGQVRTPRPTVPNSLDLDERRYRKHCPSAGEDWLAALPQTLGTIVTRGLMHRLEPLSLLPRIASLR